MSALFNGTWRLDTSQSDVWDPARERYVPDEVGEEIITIDVVDGVQNYEVLYGDDPVIRMGYTSRYDAPDWVDYAVRDIEARDGEDVEHAVERFRRRIKATEGTNYRQFAVGACYAQVRLVYVNERYHYRVARYADSGEPQNMLLRWMESDLSAYRTSTLDAEGRVNRHRRFVREGK